MSKNKIDTYIRFAIKSRSIIYGIDNIKKGIRQIKIIIADKTLSENSLDKAGLLCNKNNIPLVISEEELNNILNTENCRIIGITNRNMAEAIINNVGEGYFWRRESKWLK
jgi:ribosomal protein L7Ae-like RNA K-turn-binding protein